MIPTLEQAREMLYRYNKEDFHRKHAETVSGVLGCFAAELDPGREEYWRVVGMLHDIDFELYPEQHCSKCRDILKDEGVDDAIIESVVSHGYGLVEGGTVEPKEPMEKALFAADELTGLISACAAVRPSKSVSDMETKSVMKKFKTPAFAAGCSREVIAAGAERMGLTVEQLAAKTLEAMKSIAGEVGL